MAKKPSPSYAGLTLETPPPVPPPSQPESPAEAAIAIEGAPAPKSRASRRPQTDGAKDQKGQPYVTYMNPRGHRALRLYALESGTSVQGIIMEALEAWAKKHGITEPIRPLRTK